MPLACLAVTLLGRGGTTPHVPEPTTWCSCRTRQLRAGQAEAGAPWASGRAGREPGRPPGKGVFSFQRENPTVMPSSPHPDPAGHRAHSLVNRQPQPPLETEGVLGWRTPPSGQRITRQGLGSPGQLAVKLGHSVPRAGASCDSFPPSPASLPPGQTPQPDTGRLLAGLVQASGQSGTTAISTWDSRCKRGPGGGGYGYGCRHRQAPALKKRAFCKGRAGLA